MVFLYVLCVMYYYIYVGVFDVYIVCYYGDYGFYKLYILKYIYYDEGYVFERNKIIGEKIYLKN